LLSGSFLCADIKRKDKSFKTVIPAKTGMTGKGGNEVDKKRKAPLEGALKSLPPKGAGSTEAEC